MQNRNSEELFALVKGMTKWEKKSFHLYARRNINNDKLKVLALYRAINNMEAFDERSLSHKLKNVQPKQLPNLKVYLYNLLLDSLRLVRKGESIELQLHQLMDHARILYDKEFFMQSLKTLKKVKALAAKHHQISFSFQTLVMEKKIELIHGKCNEERIQSLNKELDDCSRQLSILGQLSNQSMLLYGWYKKYGTVRNETDKELIDEMFQPCMPLSEKDLSFYPELYFLQSRTIYHLIKKEDQPFYYAAMNWIDLFNTHAEMKEVEKNQYERGLYFLSEAAVLNSDAKTLHQSVNLLKESSDLFCSLIAHLNLKLFENEYDPHLLVHVKEFLKSSNNSEQIVVLCFKSALLCRNKKLFSSVIDFTNTGLNVKSSSRLDLQYQLRLLQVQAHEQLNNWEIIDYLKLSAHRFAKAHSFI